MKKVSIISINFNSSNDTIRMAESIIEKCNADYELIIIDNNSEYSEYLKLIKLNKNQNIKIIRSRKNLGFSGGNMLGVQFSDPESEYYLFLNNDTKLISDTVSSFEKACNENEKIGLISAQQIDESEKEITSYRSFPSISEKIIGRSLKRYLSKKYKFSHENTIQVEVVSGAVLFFSRKCFEEIGGFDTNYFLYCEEEDISKRVSRAGYEIHFNKNEKIHHYCGKSTNRNIDIEKEYIISYFRLLEKHFSFPSRFFLKLLLLMKYIKKSINGKNNWELVAFILNTNKQASSLGNRQKISSR